MVLKRMRRIFSLLIIGTSLGCAHSSSHSLTPGALLIRDDDFALSPAVLTKEAVQNDISLLVYALESAYSGRRFLPDNSFIRAVADLKIIAEKANDGASTDAFCRHIGTVLAGLPDDHFAVLNGKAPCGTQQGRSGPGVGSNLAIANRNSTTSRAWMLVYRKSGSMKIPVLSLSSLPVVEDSAWTGFFEKLQELKRNAPAIVIDLRGLTGGSSNAGLRMAEILYGTKVPSPISSHISSQTPESLALRVNSYFRKIHNAKVKGDAVAPYLNEKWAQSQDRLRKATLTETNHEWITEDGDSGTQFDRKLGFSRPIYLLQDRSCLSACENIVQEFEAHPCAMTVGENTGGMFHFGTVSPLILHNSRLTVFMATDYWKFKDGRFLEKKGMEPKIRVAPGEDALDAALKVAEKGAKCGL